MEQQPVQSTSLTSNNSTEQLPAEQIKSLAVQDNTNIKFCENCHARVEGAFCSQCGQSLESSLKYFWSVILHLLDDIFSFDSRASRTMFPLFFRPGFLTNQYIAGKRVHYVPPLRLYLFISIVFFISLKFFTDSATGDFEKEHSALNEYNTFMTELKEEITTASNDEKVPLLDIQDKLQSLEDDLKSSKSSSRYRVAKRALDIQLNRYKDKEQLTPENLEELAQLSEKLAQAQQGLVIEYNDPTFSIGNTEDKTLNFAFLSEDMNELINKKANEVEAKIEKHMAENPTKLIDYAIAKLPPLMFVILPLFALLLKIFYLFSKRLYMEHLTVALHSHSFIFFAILLVEILDVSHDAVDANYPGLAEAFSTVAMCILIWMPVYLFMMQKKVYKQGYIFTFIKYNIIGLIYIMMIALTGVAAFIWGIVEA
ncbi:DUF3667 domain-containing protein [Thalassotalea fusca]